jgi:hypothetical protein
MEINKDSRFNIVEYTTNEVVPYVEDDSFETVMEMRKFTQSLRLRESDLKNYSVSFATVVLGCVTSTIVEMLSQLMELGTEASRSERSAILTVTEDGTLVRIDPNFESTGFIQGYQPVEFLGEEEQLGMKKLFSKLMRDPEMVINAMQEATLEFEMILDQRKRYLLKSDAEHKQMNNLLKDIEVLDDVGKSEDTPTEEAL